eukprot:TRINITY_DN1079_c0_g1_i1.p1 TRINITY_DN1079_c0_g1~~TRINITY_DN1079_c0_g1_i1.p1  ORF type:complete len:428 (-),score=191.28 TRINITY_DN1079_c0_g1_i1:130-1413(-)
MEDIAQDPSVFEKPELEARYMDVVQRLQNLHNENERLKRNLIASEQEEEFIANNLMKRLDQLRIEKETLMVQVEQEEEYLTNTLQQKLTQLKREKVDLENQFEQEEEYLTNKLQKQLEEALANNQKLLHQKAEACEGLQTNVGNLQKQLVLVRDQLLNAEKQKALLQSQYDASKEKNKKLESENFVLKQHLSSRQIKIDELRTDHVRLEMDLERQSEKSMFDAVPLAFKREDLKSKRFRSASMPIRQPNEKRRTQNYDATLDAIPTSPSNTASVSSSVSVPRVSFNSPMSMSISTSPSRSFIVSDSVHHKTLLSRSPNAKFYAPAELLQPKRLMQGLVRYLDNDSGVWISGEASLFSVRELQFVSESEEPSTIDLDAVSHIEELDDDPPYQLLLRAGRTQHTFLFDQQIQRDQWKEAISDLSPAVSM